MSLHVSSADLLRPGCGDQPRLLRVIWILNPWPRFSADTAQDTAAAGKSPPAPSGLAPSWQCQIQKARCQHNLTAQWSLDKIFMFNEHLSIKVSKNYENMTVDGIDFYYNVQQHKYLNTYIYQISTHIAHIYTYSRYNPSKKISWKRFTFEYF